MINSERRLLKAIRACGFISLVVFGFSLLCVPASSSAMGEKIRNSPAEELFDIVSDGIVGFAWMFGGMQAILAGIVIVCASLAMKRTTAQSDVTTID
jgi:hypothetical protein